MILYQSESGRHRHRDDGRSHDRHHSRGDRSRSSRHSGYSDSEPEYRQGRQNGSHPPPSPPLPAPKPHSTAGLDMMPSVPSYVDIGTSTSDHWYYHTQPVVCLNHQTPVSPPPPYTSSESLHGCWPSTFAVPACGLAHCGNQAIYGSGHNHYPCVTVPMTMCSACCEALVLQGYPCLEALHI